MTNREVFAVPGNITSRNSFGTNYLIKGAGAKLIQAWQDVVAEFPPDIAAVILPPEAKNKGGSAPAQTRRPADLSESESVVFKLLRADEPLHIDALAEMSGLQVQALAGVLLSLEMRELVRQLPGKCFVRKISGALQGRGRPGPPRRPWSRRRSIDPKSPGRLWAEPGCPIR